MKSLLIITGPQGSGNHLFSKVFATSPEVFGWHSLLSTVWQGHHEEPFAEYWQTPSTLYNFNWRQKDYYVANISCPFFYNSVPNIPKYREFITEATKYVDVIKFAIIGRDQNILELQQTRLRGGPTSHIAQKEFEYIFDNFDCTFLSQELLYLYKQRYVKYIARQLDWPIDHTDTRLDDILSKDANAKYVAQAAGKLDEYIISASKNSFRTQ